jgi:hypothetical protein
MVSGHKNKQIHINTYPEGLLFSWSPDLAPPDYYLWGAMNGAVYKDNPHTLLKLKEAIANFIRNIPPIEE